MVYTVQVADKPRKFVEKTFPSYKGTVKKKLEELQFDPRPRGCIPLEGRNDCYRIRVGPFRIQYAISDKDKTVVVFKISRRDETTYK